MTQQLPASPQRLAQAFAARDRSWDGRFIVAVTSTRIYCRPSCPARRPLPENIRFLASVGEAQAQGFRPCKRCRPDEVARDRAAVERVVAIVKASGGPAKLDKLALETGYSPAHLQRIFKREIGLSPAGFGRAMRAERAVDALSSSASVTAALYDAGYSAPSRFYQDNKGRLGMTPSAWSKGGAGTVIHWAIVPTTLGAMLLAATDKGVCRLSFNEGREELEARFPNAELMEGGAEFTALASRVVAVVEHPGQGLGSGADIPLDVKGTAFQEAVWQALLQIPPGETRTYSEIAAAAGRPKAVRAAGSANGANSVAVLIPCHRVVRSDGSIGGYAYGTDIKHELLKRERSGE